MPSRVTERVAARSEPLWVRIERNRVRVAAVVVAYVLAVAVSFGALGFVAVLALTAFGLRDVRIATTVLAGAGVVFTWGLAVGAVVGTVLVTAALVRPERRLLGHLGAIRTPTGEYADTKSALKQMSLAAGFSHSPQLWIIPDCDRVNAFALGTSEKNAVVGVTAGLVDRMDVDVQRAVFANLIARIIRGDTLLATVLSALAGPMWRASERRMRGHDWSEPGDRVVSAQSVGWAARRGAEQGSWAFGFWIVGFAAVVLSELLMLGHQSSTLAVAEKADAEGMMLLKDPRGMLRALRKVLELNNTVVSAGEAYSSLFFCWAGTGYAPESDPEFERIERLQEVLGAEGLVGPEPPPLPEVVRDGEWGT